MNTAEWEFLREVQEKKNIAHSAYHRKGGSKSRRCTLPHEKMTKGELKRMSGPVKEWQMDKFYSWSDFKAMPDDLKVEYLNGITEKQAVSAEDRALAAHPESPNQERKIAPPQPPYKTIKELSFRMDGFDGLLLDTIRVIVADRPCDIEIKVTMR